MSNMARLLAVIFVFGLTIFAAIGGPNSQDVGGEQQQTQAPVDNGINHIIWIWFENRESTQITAATAPYFASFAASNVNFTNFYGITHPSEPNYLDAFSGSTQGVTDDGHYTFPASTNNLAKQLAAAGKSWRVYAQAYPGSCSDIDTGPTVTDF